MGWEEVRRELARLDWDVAGPVTPDVLADWTRVVATLVAIRRTLGPVSAQDPIAVLATATKGATGVREVAPTTSASLDGVATALGGVLRGLEAVPVVERDRQVTALTSVAYRVAHRVQVAVPDARVRAWLQAGEMALDGALHAPSGRSSAAAAMAGWTDALASVQPIAHTATVRRTAALGHLTILRTTHQLIAEARRAGTIPGPFCDDLLTGVRRLAAAHQDTLLRHPGPGQTASPAEQAVMLRLGDAVRRLAARPVGRELAQVRLDALLRSGVGQAVVVAHLTADAAAQAAARSLQQLALQDLARPEVLRTAGSVGEVQPRASASPSPAREPDSASAAGASRLGRAPVAAAQPTIAPGTVLDGETVTDLCRRRDLGAAAAVADPADPPALLRGLEPSRWPTLVEDGRQAVVDLVASVIPMVHHRARHSRNPDDTRGEMFLQVLNAAHTFNPERTDPGLWPRYAWKTLEHSRWRGVDNAGVPRPRLQSPPTIVALGERDPASTNPDPATIVERRHSLRALHDAVDDLPPKLRQPLLQAAEGRSTADIGADLGLSASTVRRRLADARDQLRDDLAPLLAPDDDAPRYESVRPRPLDRSQHLNDKALAAQPRHEQGRGLTR